jgi:hypothetical protein
LYILMSTLFSLLKSLRFTVLKVITPLKYVEEKYLLIYMIINLYILLKFTPALNSTQLPVKLVSGALLLG